MAQDVTVVSIVPDIALNLALAVVASSMAPLLLLDGGLRVIAASTSFCHAFDIHPAQVDGRRVFDLGNGEWNVPRLRSLLEVTLAGSDVPAYEMDLTSPAHGVRRLVLHAHILAYGAGDPVRLLLTLSDVTDARLAIKVKDDLVREKAILLQEVQHRVANSLQIIASILVQNARLVQSEETRGHLNDAHHRVLSIAAVQQQLAVSNSADVALHPYLTQLCASLDASMIGDHAQLGVTVTADASRVRPDISVRLGLIVTELVINALKHAFPGGRHGRIMVDYRADDRDWILRVSDDGIGPLGGRVAKPGLGTSIVESLAKQLNARIEIVDAGPGTSITVTHTAVAIIGGNDNTEPQIAV